MELIVCLGFIYSLSLDAVVSSSRLGKACVLSILFGVFLFNLISLHLHQSSDSRSLPFGQTSQSVRSGCLTTLCIFLAKYLALLI